MSTTVTYKGNTLTTVHNTTKTLNTKGTWVEDDITIVDDSKSNLQAKTVDSSIMVQNVTADSGYDGLSSVTVNAMATATHGKPSISVNSSGLITATHSQEEGYVMSDDTTSATQQLTTKSATTYNTSTTDQTIASGAYLTGTQTIKAVQVNGLDASKIASGTTITVGDANDADRIASVTGTLSFVTYYTGSGEPSASLGSDGDIYLQS